MHPEGGLFRRRENKEHSPIRVQGIAIHQTPHLFLGAQSDFYDQSMIPDFQFGFAASPSSSDSEPAGEAEEANKIQ